MITSLQPVISSYFTAAEKGEVDALVGFTDDAAVTNEGRTWHGHR